VTDGSGNYRVDATNAGSPLPGNKFYTVRATSGLLTGSALGFLPASGVSNINVTVGGTPTPTPTPGTVTPTPPSLTAPVLSATCTVTTTGGVTVTQNSLSWTAVPGAVRYNVYQSADSGRTFVFIASTGGTAFAVSVDNNTRYDYVVTAMTGDGQESPPSNPVAVVCGNPPTPTPTPTVSPTPTPPALPDLLVTSLSAQGPRSNQEPRVGEPVTVRVTIQNASGAPVTGFFYVDAYVDQVPVPGSPGFAWVAVNGLAPGASKTVSFTYTFSMPGSHFLQAQVDTYNQIREGSESNNVSVPYPIAIQGTAATPTPTPTPGTPTPTVSPGPTGGIRGTVWASTSGGLSLAPRATVRVLSGSTPVAQTLAGPDGQFSLTSLPAGTYTVAGSLCIEGALYVDSVPGVTVTGGQTTQVTLLLENFGGACSP